LLTGTGWLPAMLRAAQQRGRRYRLRQQRRAGIARQSRREAETAPTLAGVLELQASTGQVHRKFRWTRGLFVSYSGLSARGAGSATDIICMEGCELWERHCHVNYVWAAWSRGRPAAPIMLRIGCMFVGASF